jgi:hypothetical protein
MYGSYGEVGGCLVERTSEPLRRGYDSWHPGGLIIS